MRRHQREAKRGSRGLLLTSALLAAACGGQTLSTAQYAKTLGEGEAKAWERLLPGQQLALYAGGGDCSIGVAASYADIDKGKVGPLVSDPTLARLQIIQIKSSTVRTGLGGFVALEAALEDGSKRWLKLPAGKSQGCLQPVPADLVAARAALGKSLVFSPWVPECTEIQAVGRSPAAMLVDAEGDLVFQTEDLAMGPARATDMAAGKPGNSLWVSMAKGTIKVRSDLVSKCFSQPGSDRATRPTDPLALIRTPEARCDSSQEGNQEHVECRTSLGVWNGTISDTAIELSAVRRTLGEVHFLDGRLVDGTRFARTVVAVTTGRADDNRRQRLYGAMQGAMRKALARGGTGVRLTTPGSPDVTYSVHVEVGEVQIGELGTREVPQTSQYKVRDEVRDNPKKPAARERVNTARDRVSQAEQDFRDSKAEFDRLKREARAECDRIASEQKEGWARVAGATTCAAADALIQPSDSDLQAARAELSEAEQADANEPTTITVPIMADWSYSKREFSRSARGSISVRMQAKGWPEPRVVTTPLAYTWTDYEVQGDAAHNVEGHSPDRGPIDNPEALVPYIAAAASNDISGRIRAAIDEARLERARAALAASGMEATKPGFEPVDAMAFEMAGTRLKKALLRGSTQLSDKGVPLPTEALTLGADECMTAAAVAAPGTSVVLRTSDRLFADTRGTGFAVVEICGGEAPAGKVPTVELSGKGSGEVKWTLYRTSPRAEGGS